MHMFKSLRPLPYVLTLPGDGIW